MEEQSTWRGHSFTMLVFAGIVVLCSIFFVLGMLVGRQQGQRAAVAQAEEAEAKRTAAAAQPDEEVRPELTFYRSVEESAPQKSVLDPEPPPVKRDPVVPEPSLVSSAKPDRPADKPAEKATVKPPVKETAKPAAKASAGPVINFQISAVRKSTDAEKLLSEIKRRGLKGFILAPTNSDKNPFYRVQVGPYSNPGEAELARQKLVAMKYTPIRR